MWRFRSIAILMIYIIFAIKLSSNEKIKDESEFVPTHEWQVVRKGQPIPKGLHVRMNFETGVTEAKLLDEEGTSEEVSKRTDLSLSGVPQDVDSNELLDTDVIKEALKKIESHEKASKEPKKDNDSNNYNNKFRSYEQLKEDMASLNLTTKIDAEILDELLKQHDKEIAREEVDVGTISRILEDFDYLAHQFDNGLEFVRQHGFQKVIYTNLNSSSGDIKENTLKLFGSLVQNNGKVQIHALETGSIPMILRILNQETNNQVKSSAVFALSCLLRRFPLAQLHFIENGGLSVIIKLLNNAPVKILVKLVTLMNDLLLENIHAVKDELLMEQYKLVNLEKLLLENDWCNYINNLIVSVFSTEPSDHDSIEKCLLSMRTLAKQCNKQFSVEILNTLSNNYKILADNHKILSEPDNGDNFFINIHELCVDILHSTNIKTDEL